MPSGSVHRVNGSCVSVIFNHSCFRVDHSNYIYHQKAVLWLIPIWVASYNVKCGLIFLKAAVVAKVFHSLTQVQIIFTIGVSVRLTDRSLHREEQKKKLVKNCPQRGFLKWALFVSCTTSHVGLCSFLESTEHDFIKAMKIQAGNWLLA